MRKQVKEKLDEIVDRYHKIFVQLTKEEQVEFYQAVLEEIE